MNRLNGRMKGGDLLGHVYLDGEEHKHIGHLNPGFVPQFDIMHSGKILPNISVKSSFICFEISPCGKF